MALRGRGFSPLTGKTKHQAVSDWADHDWADHDMAPDPQLAATFKGAAAIASAFWSRKG